MEDNVSHMDTHASTKSAKKYNKVVLKLFESIHKNSKGKGNESCVALISHLADNVPINDEGELSFDLQYCLKRLVRGLGGTDPKLQKSNFTALVAILHSFPSIAFDTFNKFVDIELNGQDVSSKEEGGIFTGRILSLGAVVRSGLFERCSTDQKLNITKSLLIFGLKKKNLSSVSLPFLLDLIQNSADDDFTTGIWPSLQEYLAKPWNDQTLDTLLLLMAVLSSHSDIVPNKRVQKWLGCRFLSINAMPHFAEKLLVVNGAVNLEHPFYEEFCNIICAPNQRALLEVFWTVEVTKQMSSSRNRDLSFLHILSLLMKKIPNKETIYVLATVPTLQTVSRILQVPHIDKEHFPDLRKKARDIQSALEKALVAADVADEVRLKLLNSLYNLKGSAGVHLASMLVKRLSLDGLKKLAEQFRSLVLGIPLSDDQQLTVKSRMQAAQHLAKLVCLQTCCKEVEWKVKQMNFLAEYGLFEHPSNISSELAATLKQCFFRALDQKFSSLEVISEVLFGVVKHLNGLLYGQNQLKLSLRVPFDCEASSAWQKMLKTVHKLEKKGISVEANRSIGDIFHTLFLFMGLELFAEASMAQDALTELQECYSRIRKGKQVTEECKEPAWVEVAVELLLSFLSHDSHTTRTVVCSVFPHLSKHITASSFGQILKVLDPAQGENPLSDAQESESDDDSEISDHESSHVNGKKKKNGHSNGKDGGSSSSEEDSGDDMDEEDDPYEEEEQLIDKLRLELHQALGDSAALTDTESVDVDDIDDEEGERMNAALSEAFKSFVQSKPGGRKKSKQNIKKEEAISHFRTRVLDLVELYLCHEPSMALCLEVITPLLNLYAFCTKNIHRKALGCRVKAVLVKLTGLRKFSSCENVDDTILANKIKSLTAKGIKTSSAFLSLADLIVECCTFAVRCSIWLNSQSKNSKSFQHENPIVNTYKDMLSEFFTKRDTLLPASLFKSVFQLNWDGCWTLLSMVVAFALDSNIRLFCRRQALTFLTIVFRNNFLLASANSTRMEDFHAIASNCSDYVMNILKGEKSIADQPKSQKLFLAELFQCLAVILTRPELETLDKSALSSALSETTTGLNKELKKAIDVLAKACICSERLSNGSKNMKKNEGSNANNEILKCNGHGEDKGVTPKVKKTKCTTALVNFEKKSGVDVESNFSNNKIKKQKKFQKLNLKKKGTESASVGLPNGCGMNGNVSENEVQHNKTSELKRKSKHTGIEVHHSKKHKR